MFTSTSQLHQKQVQLSAGSMTYLTSGTSSDEVPLLFLHGWGIAAKPYREVIELLSQYHSVIVPDLPGFADSKDFGVIDSYDRYANLLLEFLAALNIERVHVIGHSLGGGIAITMAAQAPEAIATATLVDSTGIPVVGLLEIPLIRALEMTLQISPTKFYLQFLEIPQVFVPNLIFNLPNVITALVLSLQKDLRSRIAQTQAPCLLLWSSKDLTTPLSAAEEMHQLIPQSRLVVVEEGYHEWGLWYPEKFTSIITNFIDQHTQR